VRPCAIHSENFIESGPQQCLRYYVPARNRRGHKAMSVCLTSVAYIGPKSRTERPRKTKICTEVAHITRDSVTIFKVKRSNVKVTRPLYSPPCWRVKQLQRWAWVMRSWPWETAATLPSARRREALRRPRGDERGISWRPPAYSLFCLQPDTSRHSSTRMQNRRRLRRRNDGNQRA